MAWAIRWVDFTALIRKMSDRSKWDHNAHFMEGMVHGIKREWREAAEEFKTAQRKATRPEDKKKYHCLVEAMYRIMKYH